VSDPFSLLGFDRPRFHVDERELERAWLERSRKVHPDRFATKGDAERRAAAQQTVALNDAYRAIKDPFDRATWLVRKAGIEPAGLDQALLVELMEAREEAEASAEGRARVVAEATARFQARMTELSALLRQADEGGYDARTPALERAGRMLAELKTLARLVDDLGEGKLISTLSERG
jgi:molecular chaperone HscB